MGVESCSTKNKLLHVSSKAKQGCKAAQQCKRQEQQGATEKLPDSFGWGKTGPRQDPKHHHKGPGSLQCPHSCPKSSAATW